MEAIVLVDRNWGIGKEGNQICFIKKDLAHFREVTLHHAVVFGRKTLATFPGQKPLPNRKNYMLSTSAAPDDFAGITVCRNVAELLDETREEQLVVIGGQQVYTALLPYCDRVYVTKVDANYDADRFFPNLDDDADWIMVNVSEPMEENGITFTFAEYLRK